MVRTQIYLEESQRRRLTEKAAAAGTTVSEVIRRAVDAELGKPDPTAEWRSQWSRVVVSTAGIAPALPAGGDYVDQIRAEERHRRRRPNDERRT